MKKKNQSFSPDFFKLQENDKEKWDVSFFSHNGMNTNPSFLWDVEDRTGKKLIKTYFPIGTSIQKKR